MSLVGQRELHQISMLGDDLGDELWGRFLVGQLLDELPDVLAAGLPADG